MNLKIKKRPKLKSVAFNAASGLGQIVINGKLRVHQGIDDPVIEIWNAVQLKMQTAIMSAKGRELINFTPLFPTYDKERDETIYELAPTKYAGIPIKNFLKEAETTLEVFYKNLFMASFCQFLDDDNEICNYNGYSLYYECMKRIEKEPCPKKREYDIQTIKMLLENFLYFLSLPLPTSKEQYERQATLLTEKLAENGEWDKLVSFIHRPDAISVSNLLA